MKSFTKAASIDQYVPGSYGILDDSSGRIAGRRRSGNAPEHIKRRHLKDLSGSRITTSIITPGTEFPDVYLVEAMRGCPWNCRFCAVGNIYNPPRKKGLARKSRGDPGRQGEVKKGRGNRPFAFGLSSYKRTVLEIPGVDFSITSLRAGKKSADLISMIKGHKSVSIAPEAGTERLRRVINKRITEEDILFTAELMFKKGIETLRLYFMIGPPTETQDIEGIV